MHAEAVDVALVLAVDCSSSVDAGDFRLQMDGISSALRDAAVLNAIAAGENRQIALALVQWSSRRAQFVSVNWRTIATPADIESAALAVEQAERRWVPGGTGLAAAITFGTALFTTLALPPTRRVLDISGDGQDNEAGLPSLARNAAVAQGVTINGLPILNGSKQLEPYYVNTVIGGSGAFCVPAQNMGSFRDAMLRKLLREISPGVV